MLSAGENLIGRNPECAIWIDASGVSRRHARVRLDADSGTAAIEDLGSTNGTFVNDARVDRRVRSRDGDVVQVGSVPLTFRTWLPEEPLALERSVAIERSRDQRSDAFRAFAAE